MAKNNPQLHHVQAISSSTSKQLFSKNKGDNNVLLVKIGVGRFGIPSIIIRLRGKQTPPLINQPLGKEHLWELLHLNHTTYCILWESKYCWWKQSQYVPMRLSVRGKVSSKQVWNFPAHHVWLLESIPLNYRIGSIYVYIIIDLFIYLSIYLSIDSFIYLLIDLIVHLFIYLYLYLFIYSFLDSFIWLFIIFIIYIYT